APTSRVHPASLHHARLSSTQSDDDQDRCCFDKDKLVLYPYGARSSAAHCPQVCPNHTCCRSAPPRQTRRSDQLCLPTVAPALRSDREYCFPAESCQDPDRK